MSVSNEKKSIITMDAASDELEGNPYIDYLCYTTTSAGAAGNSCTVQDDAGDPVAFFPVDGANYTGIRWINKRIKRLNISAKVGTGGVLYVHLRK